MVKQRPDSNIAVKRFVSSAQAYCELLEADFAGPAERMDVLLQALVDLYAAALHLPDAASAGISSPRFEYSEQLEFREKLRRRLGGERPYRIVFDPFDLENAESVFISIEGDLSDIYFDVKPGLLVVERDSKASSHVIWEWRFGFRSHWWWHATGAMRALNALIVTDAHS